MASFQEGEPPKPADDMALDLSAGAEKVTRYVWSATIEKKTPENQQELDGRKAALQPTARAMAYLYDHSEDRDALQPIRQQHAKDLHAYVGRDWGELTMPDKQAVREHEMAILGIDRIAATQALEATVPLTPVDQERLIHFAKVAREYGKSGDIPDGYAAGLAETAKAIFVKYPEQELHSTKPPATRALGKGTREVVYSSGTIPPPVRKQVKMHIGEAPPDDVLDVLPYSPRVLTPEQDQLVSDALAGKEDSGNLFTAESLGESRHTQELPAWKIHIEKTNDTNANEIAARRTYLNGIVEESVLRALVSNARTAQERAPIIKFIAQRRRGYYEGGTQKPWADLSLKERQAVRVDDIISLELARLHMEDIAKGATAGDRAVRDSYHNAVQEIIQSDDIPDGFKDRLRATAKKIPPRDLPYTAETAPPPVRRPTQN